jgi:hypothetical protein
MSDADESAPLGANAATTASKEWLIWMKLDEEISKPVDQRNADRVEFLRAAHAQAQAQARAEAERQRHEEEYQVQSHKGTH